MIALSRQCAQRVLNYSSRQCHKYSFTRSRAFSSKAPEEINNEPIKFSQSKAASWIPQSSYSGSTNSSNKPWYQPYVVSLSLTVFLVYFCVLREESDVDQKLEVSLYDRIPGLERKQIEVMMKYNDEHGKDNADLRRRLDELNVSKGS